MKYCVKCGRPLPVMPVTYKGQTYGFFCAWNEGYRGEGK